MSNKLFTGAMLSLVIFGLVVSIICIIGFCLTSSEIFSKACVGAGGAAFLVTFLGLLGMMLYSSGDEGECK